MHRFFVEPAGDTARITGEDFQHLNRVLRLKPGDAVTLCDGRGTDYEARIAVIEPDVALCRIHRRQPSPAEPVCQVTLFQCLPKAGKLETIIQKCTELGVHAIIPTVSHCCTAVPENFSNKLIRFRRVAYEAAKQSRRGMVPRVDEWTSLDKIDPAAFDLALIAYEREDAHTLRDVLRDAKTPGSAALIVGPEGGFEPDEAIRLVSCGAIAVSLGPRILRTETAGPAMLAQLLYEVEP